MNKVFISHSSKQKDSFAIPIMEKVGRNLCFVDAYDFQPAFRTMDEIIEKLDKTSIFVFWRPKTPSHQNGVKKKFSKQKNFTNNVK